MRAQRRHLREENQRLRLEVDRLRREGRARDARIAQLRERVDVLQLEVRRAVGTAVGDDAEVPCGPESSSSLPRAVRPRRKRGPRFGHPGTTRPRPKHIDEFVDTRAPRCPHCGSTDLEACGEPYEHIQEDLVPAHVKVTSYRHQPMRCRACQGLADPLGPDELAGSVIFGPHVRAAAVELHYGVGLSYDNVAKVLKHLAGLAISPGTLVNIDRRTTAVAEPLYEALCQRLRAAAVVYSDETGWRSDGMAYHLWSLSNAELVVNHIDRRRDHDVAERFLGKPFGGTLVTDCASAYSPVEASGGKQKCHAHLARSARQLRLTDGEAPGVAPFVEAVVGFVARACALDAERKAQGLSQWPLEEAMAHKAHLEACLERLLAMDGAHPGVARLQGRLARHRDEWLTFLLRPGVEPTNNRAERQLRPSVIVRKITHGNRSHEGMHCHSILTSILATAERHGNNPFDFLVTVLSRPTDVARDAMLAPP